MAVVYLDGIRIIVFIITICKEFLAYVLIGGIGQITKMIAIKTLYGHTTDHIPRIIRIVRIPHEAVGILREALLTYEVGLFDFVAFVIRSRQTELR